MEDLIDDDTLHSELKVFYPNIGPVVNTTRELYRKMLEKAQLEAANVVSVERSEQRAPSMDRASPREVSFSDPLDDRDGSTEDDEDDDDELTRSIDASDIIEGGADGSMDNLSQHSLSPTTGRRKIRTITIEEEPAVDNFFTKSLVIGLIVVGIAVGALWMLRAVTDF